MSLLCFWGDPTLGDPSQPTAVKVHAKTEEIRIKQAFTRSWQAIKTMTPCSEEEPQRSCVHSPENRERDLLLSPLHAVTWESEFVSFIAPYISYPFAIWLLSVRTSKVELIVLMIMCHSDMALVRHKAGLPAKKTRRGFRLMLCCAVVGDWWLSLF